MARKRATTRNTTQKDAVRQVLKNAAGFVSAQDLHRRLDTEGNRVGLATVYRQLGALADEGEADIVSTAEGQLFRVCWQPDRHHHHLICETCGDAVEVALGDEDWFARVAADHGYAVTRHSLEIFGRCPRCRTA
ncbi:transcriptional repressor [Citricoccus nitrophenolicus]